MPPDAGSGRPARRTTSRTRRLRPVARRRRRCRTPRRDRRSAAVVLGERVEHRAALVGVVHGERDAGARERRQVVAGRTAVGGLHFEDVGAQVGEQAGHRVGDPPDRSRTRTASSNLSGMCSRYPPGRAAIRVLLGRPNAQQPKRVAAKSGPVRLCSPLGQRLRWRHWGLSAHLSYVEAMVVGAVPGHHRAVSGVQPRARGVGAGAGRAANGPGT